MPLPRTISFTLEGQLVFPPEAPAAPPKEGDGKSPSRTAATPPPVFGPEYGGMFTLRYPTLDDELELSVALQRYFEARGVAHPGSMPETAQLAGSLLFFDRLATERPAWCRGDGDADAVWAVIRARQVALDALRDAKKKPEPTGGS